MNREIKSVYLIGICGVAMGSLAGMLKERGYAVAGSDSSVYPPMSDMLAKWGVTVHDGFDASRVGSPDLVIVGNAISRGNPEAEYVLNKRIPYMSMAQALHDFFLEGKEVVAVAGTHGKTTTTALLAHILATAGLSPSFFVGGVPVNYGSNFMLGDGRHFIIEGDEYDSAFFDKTPKFMSYRPHHLVLTSLEFDHADIYANVDEIRLWFRRLMNIIPSESKVVYCVGYPHLADVVRGARCSCKSYGGECADYTWRFLGTEGDACRIEISLPSGPPITLETLLFGSFNFANIAGASAMALSLGVDRDAVVEGVRTFRGVKRRQELIYSKNGLRMYEDFAHHPTAIRSVLSMLKARHPGARLWALYEPRSATSRRNVFQDELAPAFTDADVVYIKSPYRIESIPERDRIDIDAVIQAVKSTGRAASRCDSADEMVAEIFRTLDPRSDNVLAILSNGGFDGIYEKLRVAAELT